VLRRVHVDAAAYTDRRDALNLFAN
jgi:hypothetical protein